MKNYFYPRGVMVLQAIDEVFTRLPVELFDIGNGSIWPLCAPMFMSTYMKTCSNLFAFMSSISTASNTYCIIVEVKDIDNCYNFL